MGPFTEAWRAELRPFLTERGAKADLARWLVENLGGTLQTRQVQLARVLNSGVAPDLEFALACNAWTGGKKRPKPRG